MFENLHVLPPERIAQIEETIEAIDKRIDYFNNPSEEDIKKHREKVKAEIEEEKAERERRREYRVKDDHR